MLQWIMNQIEHFLNQFWAKPSGSSATGPYVFSWEQAIRYEATHFLFSASLGFLLFSLTLTIFSYPRFKEYDRFMWNISFLVGLSVSATVHILIDAYTTLA